MVAILLSPSWQLLMCFGSLLCSFMNSPPAVISHEEVRQQNLHVPILTLAFWKKKKRAFEDIKHFLMFQFIISSLNIPLQALNVKLVFPSE